MHIRHLSTNAQLGLIDGSMLDYNEQLERIFS